MTVKELTNRVNNVIANIEQKSQEIAIMTAISGLSIVKDRSINKGIFVDGIEGNYKDYSTTPVPTFFFYGKELNQKGTKFIKDNKLGTWQEFSEAQGRKKPDNHINLSYSNRMWTSLAVIKTGEINGVIMAAIGTTDQNVETYLFRLVDKYGNFLKPTDDETYNLIIDATNEMITYLKQELFNA